MTNPLSFNLTNSTNYFIFIGRLANLNWVSCCLLGVRVRLFLGCFVGLSFLLSVGFAASFEEGAFDNYTADIEMGKRLFNAASCSGCHQDKNGVFYPDAPELGGGLEIDSPTYGLIKVPNISGSEAGIGSWSRAQFLNAMLLGQSADGGQYIPIFPFEFYSGMKPEHVIDMFEYIKTALPKSPRVNEPNELLFMNRIFGKNPWRYSFDFEANKHVDKGNDDENSLLWGEYLVENVAACGSCHTPRNSSFILDASQKHESSISALREPIEAGVGTVALKNVGRDDFIHKVIARQQTLDLSREMTGSMAIVAGSLKQLPTADLEAIYQYMAGLKTPERPTVAAECKAQASLVNLKGDDLSPKMDIWLQQQCKSCHVRGASASNKALLARPERVATDIQLVLPGNPEQSLLYQSIAGIGSASQMPPAGTVSDANKKLVYDWINSMSVNQSLLTSKRQEQARDGSRLIVSNAKIYEITRQHLLGVSKKDQKFIRYLSFQNYFNGHLPCQNEAEFIEQHLTPYLAALNKMTNSLSWERKIKKVEPVDGLAAVYAIDIRDYGWHSDQWETLVSGNIIGLDEVEPYPYGETVSGHNADENLKTLAQLTETDVPIMRADWFVAHAGEPYRYKMMLDLPDDVKALEAEKLNVNFSDAINEREVIRLGFLKGESGVSDNNRLLDRMDLPNGGYYWVSYDFDRPVNGSKRLKERPLGPKDAFDSSIEVFEHDGGEMLFSLPNGMQAYYLTTASGQYLDAGPTSVVFYRNQLSPVSGITITNGQACMACHINGVIQASDGIKDSIKITGIAADQREAFDELYLPDEMISEKFKQDMLYYLASLEEAGGKFNLRTDLKGPGVLHEEVVTNLTARYFEQLDKNNLAAEFGLTFAQLETASLKLKQGSAARIALRIWFAELGGRGLVERADIERGFQIVNAALRGQDMRVVEANAPDYTLKTKVVAGAKYETKHSLKLSALNTEVKVCEPIKFTVESNQDCRLQILYPQTQDDGSSIILSLPQNMMGAPILKAGEKRSVPQIFCEETAEGEACQVFSGRSATTAKITVMCLPNLAAGSSVLDAGIDQIRKTMDFGISQMIVKKAVKKLGATPSIPAFLQFTISEDLNEEFSSDGVCNAQ